MGPDAMLSNYAVMRSSGLIGRVIKVLMALLQVCCGFAGAMKLNTLLVGYQGLI